jgi:purine-binding chemotaxis protein CheW
MDNATPSAGPAPEHQALDTLASGGTVQFISFKIGDEEYAIDIMAVREIRAWSETTPLPNQPDFVRGVLNLRGTIVPIYDLRRRFGLGVTEAGPTHVIVIVHVLDRTVGLLVDAVSDILTVSGAQIRPVPDADRVTAAEFLSGIIAIDDGMVVMLALEKLFTRPSLPAAIAA